MNRPRALRARVQCWHVPIGERGDRAWWGKNLNFSAFWTLDGRPPSFEAESLQMVLGHEVRLAVGVEDHSSSREIVDIGGPDPSVVTADESSTTVVPLELQPSIHVCGEQRH
jgi:hypothetical protein